MRLKEVKEKEKKGKLKLKLPTGETATIDLDDGHVEIVVAPNTYYHTWLDPETKEFVDHKGRKWRVE